MADKLHRVVGSDNVFSDLGFPEAKAQNLLVRGELFIHIRKVIDKLGITQAEAAKRPSITLRRMNDQVKTCSHNLKRCPRAYCDTIELCCESVTEQDCLI